MAVHLCTDAYVVSTRFFNYGSHGEFMTLAAFGIVRIFLRQWMSVVQNLRIW
jgi:hypothetical protein